ncbi:MAG: hypothetical protein NTY19_44290 [Planctomycetota bacterium]|nr:hypothetical protein [Planctomycetota bacterium]
MMQPVNQSQPQITRRAALAASAAGVAALWLPESVRAQHESPSETNLQRILSGMALADKVGQLGKVFDRLMQAVASKRLTLERLDEAVLRNLKFLDWLGLLGADARVAPDRADELLRNEADSCFLARIVGAASSPHDGAPRPSKPGG